MNKRIRKRALAVLLSALMVIGLIPQDLSLTGTKAFAASDSQSAGSHIFDAADLDVATLGTAALTSDTPVGTDNFFTIIGSSESPKIDPKNKVVQFAEGQEVNTPFGKYTQALQLGGGLKKSGQAALKFTVTKPSKLTVYAAVKAKNDTKYHFQLSKDGADPVTYFDMVNDTAVCNKIEVDLEAGTYLLGGDNGGNIFYVEVEDQKDTKGFTVNGIDEALFTDKSGKLVLAGNCGIGTDGFFKVTTEGDKVKLNTRSDVERAYNGVTYANVLTMDGKMDVSKEKASVGFTVTQTSRVRILAAAKSTSASNLWLQDGSKNDMADPSEMPLAYDAVQEYVVDALPAGTYYIGGSNGADICEIKVEAIGRYSVDANDIPSDLVSADSSTKVAADVKLGTEEYFTVLAQGEKNALMKATNESEQFNGKTYTQKIELTGGAKVNGTACIQISVKETARITMIASAKGSSCVGKNIGLQKVGASELNITSMGQLGDVGVLQEYVMDNVKPGEYYIASEKGADIFEIVVEYDPLDLSRKAWDEVETPVINSVETDENGNFAVNFSAVVDKVSGADYAYVIMYEDGKEVDTTTVSTQTDTVTMVPLWSGNYSFEVVAVREGEAWKRSEKKEVNNYILAVRKPVIVAEENRGSGKYYVDWFNLDEADVYSVQVKGQDGAYQTAAENLTDAHYEITGLSEGTHTVKIIAKRNSDGFESFYEKDITVSSDATPKWYVATSGSAQTTNAVITEADGKTTEIQLNSQDTANPKTNFADAPNITNTAGKISLAASTSGKISDGEEGFSYYFTYLDPNTENFKLSAKFKITDVSLTPDNQTGFGIMATDLLGINFFGAPDYYHKLYNEVSAIFWQAKAPRSCMRVVTGYSDPDTSNSDGVDRVMEEQQLADSNPVFEVGKEVTFTLEKTNEKFIVTCNGESKELADTSVLSVQEDGSICVGVMTSRKVGVEVSDITYTTSESTGVSGAVKDTRITPNATVYSTGTSGSTAYEYIYAANTAGNLKLSLNGTEIYNKAIEGDTAIRIPATLVVGSNTFESVFTPSGTAETLTKTDPITKTLAVECKQYGQEDRAIIVAPDGTADGNGIDKPLDLQTAVKYVRPGQTILLKDGVYTTGIEIARSVSGTADKMITMVPENVGAVKFDAAAIRLVGSYWHIYGLEVANVSSGNGILVAGNHNIVEMCTVHGSTNTGIQISRAGSADNKLGIEGELWPSHNLVKNCESYDNCDAGRNDADGFAAKLTSGNGNVFYGCIGHHNIDDGWDLFAKTISGEIGSVTIENCIAYNNGWLTTDDTKAEGYNYGEGNGFKLGGGYLKGGHVLKNSITFANGAKGITSNSCPDCEVYNCTDYGNSVIPNKGAYNIGLNRKATAVMGWKVSGLISMGVGNTSEADLFPVSLQSANNYIYNGKASYNTEGVEASDKWFKSVDVSKVPTRNEDGTINMDGLLELVEGAPADSGARLDVTSDAAKSVKPEVKLPINIVPDVESGVSEVEQVGDVVVKSADGAVVENANVEVVVSEMAAEIKANVEKVVEKAIEEVINKAEIKLSSEGAIKKYMDISLMVGDQVVQLDSGKLRVTLTKDADIDYNKFEVKVYHYNESTGALEDMNAEVTDKGISFVTGSFSPYVIVYIPKAADVDTPQTGDQPQTSDQPQTGDTPQTGDKPQTGGTPQTGDTAPIMLYSVLALMAVAAFVLALFEKKRKMAR